MNTCIQVVNRLVCFAEIFRHFARRAGVWKAPAQVRAGHRCCPKLFSSSQLNVARWFFLCLLYLKDLLVRNAVIFHLSLQIVMLPTCMGWGCVGSNCKDVWSWAALKLASTTRTPGAMCILHCICPAPTNLWSSGCSKGRLYWLHHGSLCVWSPVLGTNLGSCCSGHLLGRWWGKSPSFPSPLPLSGDRGGKQEVSVPDVPQYLASVWSFNPLVWLMLAGGGPLKGTQWEVWCTWLKRSFQRGGRMEVWTPWCS